MARAATPEQAGNAAAAPARHPELQSGPVRSTDVDRVTVPLGLFRSIIHLLPLMPCGCGNTGAGRQPDGSNEYNGQNHLRFLLCSIPWAAAAAPPPRSNRGGAGEQHGVTRGLLDAWLVRKERR